MKALSIRQPWAWLIVNGGKDIENRDWPTQVRGRVWIHESKGMTRAEYGEAVLLAMRLQQEGKISSDLRLPSFDQLERGGIVGSVEIVGCVTESDSPWFFGNYGFQLANARPHHFTPCNGALGFFKPERPEEVR